MALLELRGISKGYGDKASTIQVVRDIDLDVHEGELLAIVGHSGAGKSTLLQIIAGLTRPDRGTVTLPASPSPGPVRIGASCSRATRCCPG